MHLTYVYKISWLKFTAADILSMDTHKTSKTKVLLSETNLISKGKDD
jgi:hypothetical protein